METTKNNNINNNNINNSNNNNNNNMKSVSERRKFMDVIFELKSNLALVEKKESRYISRVLRHIKELRRMITTESLHYVVDSVIVSSSERKAFFLNFLPAKFHYDPVLAEQEDKAEFDELMQKLELEKLELAKKENADKEKKKKEEKEKKLIKRSKGLDDSDDEEEEKLKAEAEKKKSKSESDAESESKDRAKQFEDFKQKKIDSIKLTASDAVEVEYFIQLLIVIHLVDKKKYEEALRCVTDLYQHVNLQEKRSLDDLAAKIFFYYMRVNELLGNLGAVRADLLATYRTACLHHNEAAEATLINALLRSYLNDHMYDQADKLAAKTTFPASATNNEHARYFYYLGRVKAIQLDYTDSHKYLTLAIRKAPQSGATGFRLIAHKLSCIVQLLIGEIPDRQVFDDPDLVEGLLPYLHLTKTVKVGDLVGFKQLMQTHHQQFERDRTFNLIMRLRHNVIKAGLKKISLSYSKISFVDICAKLHLESPLAAESIVSKAIRDGVIEATIDQEGGFVTTHNAADVYTSLEPQTAFHARITFALNTHNDAVKAMRFEDKKDKGVYKDALASSDGIINLEDLMDFDDF